MKEITFIERMRMIKHCENAFYSLSEIASMELDLSNIPGRMKNEVRKIFQPVMFGCQP